MPAGFPPLPVFPIGIDNDYTLYSVHNTTSSRLSDDSQAWSDEVDIVPVPLGDPEIWSSNGFATLSGELFYYDSVNYDSYGRVITLKRCARNLGGTATRFNPVGTPIWSFVIAEHHNQIAQGILNVEDFVGINFDTRLATLDYRIRHLQATPVIWDDFSCPDVTLFFNIISSDPASGTIANYNISIQGSYNSFRIDFGDGNFTTSTQNGTHTYAPNAIIDPVVTVGNDQCTITETDIVRSTLTEPTIPTSPTGLIITVPEFPAPPAFIFPPLGPINAGPEFPPIVFPCFNLTPFPGISINIGPIDIQVPSVITFQGISIPNIISITPIDIPSVISISPISIPSIINFGPAPTFSPIGFAPAPQISPIGFAPPPSINPIDINVTLTVDGTGIPSCISIGGPGCGGLSAIGVDWGTPPTLNVAFVHALSSQQAKKKYTREDIEMMKELGDDYLDYFPESEDAFQIEYSSLGIPTEISILPPTFTDIQIKHDLPTEISIVKGNYDLNGTIQILPPTIPLPTEIQIINNLPETIQLVSDLPSVIRVEHDIPNKIIIEGLVDFPKTINFDTSNIPDQIAIVGCPKTIELVFPQETIKLTIDENLSIPLVFRDPIPEIKVEMPKFFVTDDDDDYPRVKIVPAPCPKR